MPENAPASQTLSRGIRILEILAEAREPLSIDDVAHRLGVHRSVAYRLVRTLEEHGLVVRGRGPAAVAVVFVASAHSDDEIAARLTASATAIREALGG